MVKTSLFGWFRAYYTFGVWAHKVAYLVGSVGTQKYSSTIKQIYIRWWILGASKYASSHMEYITQLHCRKHSWQMYNTSWNSLHAVWSTRIWSIRNEHWSSIKCYLEAVTSLLLHKDKKNPVLNHFNHYIQHLCQGNLNIFQCPHYPQTYITTYNTSIRGVFIFSGGHTAHKLISLHTTLLSLHTTPLSGGYVYFLVATLPTNLYHYIQHLYHYIQHPYQEAMYIFWWPHCPQTYITT